MALIHKGILAGIKRTVKDTPTLQEKPTLLQLLREAQVWIQCCPACAYSGKCICGAKKLKEQIDAATASALMTRYDNAFNLRAQKRRKGKI